MNDLARYQGLQHPTTERMKRWTMAYVEAIEGPSDYAGTVDDIIFHREAVTLCDETAEYLYSEYTPLDLSTTPGMRPELERIVAQVLSPAMSRREQALALLAWVRDLPDLQPPATETYMGGTEEEIIAARSANCANQARVFACLTQLAGIPSRIVLHYGSPAVTGDMLSGHGVNEAHIDGRWAYLDIRGRYCEWPNGRIASALDLMRFPELVETQSAAVHAMARPGYDLAETRHFFAGRRITRICNYFVWDQARYQYQRFLPVADSARTARATAQRRAIAAEYLETARRTGMLG